MDTIFAETYANEQLFKVMAWVFSALAGVASIALTIHKFGLPVWKQVSLVGGVLAFGLTMVFVVIPRMGTFGGPAFISLEKSKEIGVLASELGEFSQGYKITENGVLSQPLRGEVNRVSEWVFAILHPNGELDVIYSGDFFTAQIDGSDVNCELIDVGNNRVLIVKGEDSEIVNLKSDQSEKTFKVKKVPVQPKQA